MPLVILLAFLLALLLSVVKLLRTIKRKRLPNEPPLLPGHPLFGNGAQFRENAVEFLLSSARAYGRIFTMRLLHHHVTVVMDPHAYQQFSEERHFDFDPIQRQVNKNIFQFEAINAHHLIRDAAKTVRGNTLNTTVTAFADHVLSTFKSHVANQPSGNQVTIGIRGDQGDQGQWFHSGLKTALTDTMFNAMLTTLFGKEPEESKFTAKNLGKNLEKFHDYFNFLWVGLPISMFPRAKQVYQEMLDWLPESSELLARKDLSPYVREATEIMLRNGQSEHSIKCHHTVFTHVNHNTFRATFWAIYHVLRNDDAYSALFDELNSFVQAKTIEGKAEMTVRELNALPVLDSVVKETFRHASGVFIIRAVTEDTLFKLSKDSKEEYLVRKGDKIAFYPPAIHHDPEIFPDPYKFVYNRFMDKSFFKHGQQIRSPLQPFGSLRPGVQFAQLQMKWFLLAWFINFDCHLLPNESTEYNLQNYGNEVVPEVHDVNIQYRLRQTPQLSLV